MNSLKMVGITELYKESCQTRKNMSNIYIVQVLLTFYPVILKLKKW